MFRKALLALALAGGLIAPALGQVADNLSGNETWQAGQGPGGPGAYITSSMVRGGTNILARTITGATTLGTGANAALAEGGNLIVTADPTTSTVTLPPNPVTNGARIMACNGTAGTFTGNLTIAANTGQTLVGSGALVALTAAQCAAFQFSRATTTWYRISP